MLSRCPFEVEDNAHVRRYLAAMSERWERHGLQLEMKRPNA